MAPFYEVTFHERVIVKERVEAENAREAEEAVRWGAGERVSEEVDERKGPTALRAKRLRF